MHTRRKPSVFTNIESLVSLSVGGAALIGPVVAVFLAGGGHGWTGAVAYSLSGLVLAPLAVACWMARSRKLARVTGGALVGIAVVADLTLLPLAGDKYFEDTVAAIPQLVIVWFVTWVAWQVVAALAVLDLPARRGAV